jgi:hypothetical protein
MHIAGFQQLTADFLAHAVVTQGMAEIPDFLDEGSGVHLGCSSGGLESSSGGELWRYEG